MSDVSAIIQSIQDGNEDAGHRLLPLVYDELKRIAKAQMRTERPTHTLSPTALVHEVFLKLTGSESDSSWEGKAHFFNAAAEAMRRILIDHARKKKSKKRGGEGVQFELDENLIQLDSRLDEFLEINEALERLQRVQPESANVVKLRYFVGMTNREAAKHLNISPRKADMLWAYARAWLKREIENLQT